MILVVLILPDPVFNSKLSLYRFEINANMCMDDITFPSSLEYFRCATLCSQAKGSFVIKMTIVLSMLQSRFWSSSLSVKKLDFHEALALELTLHCCKFKDSLNIFERYSTPENLSPNTKKCVGGY